VNNVERQITISGNPLLAGAVAVGAAATAAAYAVRAVGVGGVTTEALALAAVAVGLALVALVWTVVAWDARVPRMVIDDHGVRVRFAREWIGLAWADLDGMSVRGHTRRRLGRLFDGRLRPNNTDKSALPRLGRLSRWYAAWLSGVFGDPYAVPTGWTTRIVGATPDLATAVARLSGRSTVPDLPTTTDSLAPDDQRTAPVDRVHGQQPAWTARIGTLASLLSRPHPSRLHFARPHFSRYRDVVTVGANALAAGPMSQAQLSAQVSAQVSAQISALPEIEELRRPEPDLEDLDPSSHVARESDAGRDADTEPGDLGPAVVVRDTPGSPSADEAQTDLIAIDKSAGQPGGTLPAGQRIGVTLAEARLRLALSVDQLSDRTRIRPHVIESIEGDDFGPCGGDFYARGHLRTLCRVLGIEAGPLLAAYDDGFAQSEIKARQVFQADLGRQGSIRHTRGGTQWSMLVAAVMAVVLAWSIARLVMDTPIELHQPAPILNGSAGPNNAGTSTANPVLVKVKALRGARVIVRDGDGAIVFRGNLAIGEVKALDVVPPVRISANDGAAVKVAVAKHRYGTLSDTAQPANDTFFASPKAVTGTSDSTTP
jgi:Helix-turn-helix domain